MSQKASGYERIEGDKYYTPAWPVEALCCAEKFTGPVVDPCAGGWDIVHTLSHFCGIFARGFDINPTPMGLSYQPMLQQQDFLLWDGGNGVFHDDWRDILTNPPYGERGALALKFVEHALNLTEKRRGKIAMLLRVDFDSAITRRHVFDDHPAFSAKYTLLRRVRWVNLPQKSSGPTENHAWFIWDWARRPGEGRYYGYLS